MVRLGATCALVAVLALANGVAADICSNAKICFRQGLNRRCDRTLRPDCPPCLFEKDGRFECFDLDSGVCPEETTLCTGFAEPSGSGSGSATPEPTTTAPPTEPPSSGSESESGSGTPTPKPTRKTPKPTTKKPVTTEPPTETPTPSPSKNVTEAPVVTAAPVDTNSSSGGGLSMPLLVGIIGASVVVVAVIAFFIWKRNRDDDDDSDDDDDFRFKNPPATYNARGAGGAPTYANSNLSRAVTSPQGRGGNFRGGAQYGAARYGGAAGAGAAAGYGGGAKYAGATEYSSGGMYGAQYGAQADYGSPTNLNSDNRDLYTGAGGVVYENRDSLSSAEDSRDVWGNAVVNNAQGQPSRPVPTSRNVEATQRENRTLSNVSIEF